MIETQQPAEALEAIDCTEVRVEAVIGLDQLIVESLVIPLCVVMSGELSGRFPKRSLSKEDHPTETLVLDRPDEPLGVRVQVGAAARQANRVHTGVPEHVPDIGSEDRVAVHDEVGLA